MIDVMVITTNSDDYINWPQSQKIERCKRVVEWHERNARLAPERVPFSWGGWQVISQVNPSPTVHVLVAVYRATSLEDFDQYMLNDPLRDMSKYSTILLDKIEGDYEVDKNRLNTILEKVSFGNTAAQDAEIARVRARFSAAPEYVDKSPFVSPPMPLRTYFSNIESEEFSQKPNIEVLIYGMNLDVDHSWDDLTKAIHYEKVIWWHHYIAKMISEGKVSHVWATHDFCNIGAFSSRSASAPTIYRAKSLEDFAEIYRMDPLRTRAQFWSIMLKPIADQRRDDVETLAKLSVKGA